MIQYVVNKVFVAVARFKYRDFSGGDLTLSKYAFTDRDRAVTDQVRLRLSLLEDDGVNRPDPNSIKASIITLELNPGEE